MSEDALIRLTNLKALNLGPSDLVSRVGNSYPYWRDLLAGHKSFGEKIARKIESQLGLPRGCLDTTEGCKPTQDGVVKQISPPNEVGFRVPVLSAIASMGRGNEHQDEDVMTGELTLSPNFISQQIKPSRRDALAFLTGYGDSMSPTIESGDVVLVDTGARTTDVNGVFVLSAHNRIFIKRLSQRIDGSIEISSDNPGHKTIEILNGSHQVSILGRVVWVWNGRKL